MSLSKMKMPVPKFMEPEVLEGVAALGAAARKATSNDVRVPVKKPASVEVKAASSRCNVSDIPSAYLRRGKSRTAINDEASTSVTSKGSLPDLDEVPLISRLKSKAIR